VAACSPLGENRLLKRLDADDFSRLQPHLRKAALTRSAVLHAAGAPIEQVYFPLSGMISVLALMRTGELIETAIVGREGVIGAAVGTNGSRSAGQAMVQIPGSALQVESKKFSDLFKSSMSFRTLMSDYQTVLLLQAQQSAACHAFHSVEARPMPLAAAIARHHSERYGSADAGVPLAHAGGSTNIRVVVRAYAARSRVGTIFAWGHNDH
jgi:CRP-like cAMP-binding protein